MPAAEPPPDLLKRVLERETATEAVRGNYAYRQKVLVEELEVRGRKRGEYKEARDVVFTPEGQRHEQMVGKPVSTLDRLRLTEEDFRDLREVQPFLFTREQLMLYRAQFKGDEQVEGKACWVLLISPRQILHGQRLFEGLVWVLQDSYAVIRMEGRAVPQSLGLKQENLFPRFTTVRREVDGHWFPDRTVADDVLEFRNGPLRIKMNIEYSQYKRFGAESKITFGEPK
ncbi:MAG: hypothetical protein JNK87_02400 [Bryobacterales bacterium]|nr:hypothetical protein [Bryobacterales bacterium]